MRSKSLKILFEEIRGNSPRLFSEIEVDNLKKVLNTIPVGDRAILLMKYQDEMSIKEIAASLSKSESEIEIKMEGAKREAQKVYKQIFSNIELQVMSSNSFEELKNQEENQNPGPDPAIERKVKKEVDTFKNLFAHIGDFVGMISSLLTGILGGSNEDDEDGERDVDDTPQGGGKSDN